MDHPGRTKLALYDCMAACQQRPALYPNLSDAIQITATMKMLMSELNILFNYFN